VKILEVPLEMEGVAEDKELVSMMKSNHASDQEPMESSKEEYLENDPFTGDDDLEEPPAEPLQIPEKPELSPKDLPITLTVELTRLTMSVQKVLEFQPGMTFSLDSLNENSVYLSCQGKIIATGELIQVGDVLGIKITDVGT
jgi:flagellar motor switch/type III secretory pathway protein FliN